MPNLVGTGLNQVPTNSMLGGLAYQDPEHASIKDLDLKNLSQINSEIADTAVDVFVYDTRKDSDGGAWRKRTKHTSWYNETLGTATRGTRREFPAVAILILETGYLKIYDGDDPDLPMWMVLNATSSSLVRAPFASSVAMLNAKLVVTDGNNYAGSTIDFLLDDRDADRDLRQIGWNGNIADRNDTSKQGGFGTTLLASQTANDVAMTVLPNAPVDSATGLPVPTIAVATNNGVSVIKDDGRVVDYTNTATSYDVAGSLDFNDSNEILYTFDSNTSSRRVYLTPILNKDTTTLLSTSHPIESTGTLGYGAKVDDGNYNGFLIGRSINHITKTGGRTFATGDEGGTEQNGLSLIDPQTNTTAGSKESLIAHISSTYNTGWMHGDIKGAFLSDTDDTNVTGSNLIDETAAEWSTYSGTGTVSNPSAGVLRIVDSNNSYVVKQDVTTVVGQKYVFSCNTVAARQAFIQINDSNTNNLADNNTEYNGTYTGPIVLNFTATTTTTTVRISDGSGGAFTVDVDTLQLRLAEEDRSVNNKGLQVFGTITKSAVATGADLVAYSGFSASNQLGNIGSYNFGSGSTVSMCIVSWFKTTSISTYAYILSVYNSTTNEVAGLAINSTVSSSPHPAGTLYTYDNNTGQTSGTTVVNNGQWHCAIGIFNGATREIYLDGKLEISTTYNSFALDLTNVNKLGVARYTFNDTFPFLGSLALTRISKSIPSPEQIKKIYEDEKHLFQENAKATLYGSSDAVTALTFDDTTELLHVGTSAGRSEFQGLRRINNTTTAVTTAISASNGFVAEQ